MKLKNTFLSFIALSAGLFFCSASACNKNTDTEPVQKISKDDFSYQYSGSIYGVRDISLETIEASLGEVWPEMMQTFKNDCDVEFQHIWGFEVLGFAKPIGGRLYHLTGINFRYDGNVSLEYKGHSIARGLAFETVKEIFNDQIVTTGYQTGYQTLEIELTNGDKAVFSFIDSKLSDMGFISAC